MKRAMMVILAMSMFAVAMPAYAAMDHSGSRHDPENIQCQKECDLLLKDCTKQAASLQQEIKKLNASIKKDGADQAKLEQVKALKAKLDEAKTLLKELQKPGK